MSRVVLGMKSIIFHYNLQDIVDNDSSSETKLQLLIYLMTLTHHFMAIQSQYKHHAVVLEHSRPRFTAFTCGPISCTRFQNAQQHSINFLSKC